MRKRIYEILYLSDKSDRIGHIYNSFMIMCIIISVAPLFFKKNFEFFHYTDKITFFIFVFDYALRISTADIKYKKEIKSFFIYPFTPMAIADILSILPSMKFLTGFVLLHKNFKLLKFFKMIRIVRLLKNSGFYSLEKRTNKTTEKDFEISK